MKKLSWTIGVLGIISVTEMIVNHNLTWSIWLWCLYGVYKFFENTDISI